MIMIIRAQQPMSPTEKETHRSMQQSLATARWPQNSLKHWKTFVGLCQRKNHKNGNKNFWRTKKLCRTPWRWSWGPAPTPTSSTTTATHRCTLRLEAVIRWIEWCAELSFDFLLKKIPPWGPFHVLHSLRTWWNNFSVQELWSGKFFN